MIKIKLTRRLKLFGVFITTILISIFMFIGSTETIHHSGFLGTVFVEFLPKNEDRPFSKEYVLYRREKPCLNLNEELISSKKGYMYTDRNSAFGGTFFLDSIKSFLLSNSLSYNNSSIYTLRVDGKTFFSMNPDYLSSSQDGFGVHNISLQLDERFFDEEVDKCKK